MRTRLLAGGVAALALATLALGCDRAVTGGAEASASAGATAWASVVATAPEAAPPLPSAAPASPPDAIIAQHLLVIYKGARRAPRSVTRSKADARARAAEALAKIRGGAPFEQVVTQYSDDQGSVERMGSLGKFRRDAMDPAFSAAAFALQVGQVSDVVETPFGFHVIKRTQ